ncbi:zf-HC2 domain-containing protein [Burkholderia sp. BCCIQ04A]|uniref:Zf-HC2 domain-containing protein n=1 Tax=Burkholderia anthinoferrum TaxID=3090833 RepID=A0ABU5WGM9_9BURK|nr:MULTISPECIES: zf-HC2 domain-containing protein [Burkholderia]MEB2502114.1 zf-HC2 domain-containing protein [Burkholderia anthinoferrum]MEB2534968.1 zf-HC2 domain-containing protein [Burkholderia anthinoferrum]MEB2562102.1 zf-HC2 domain-containing protein [Burkholderia anthinoferrum]MEB2577587.1 zf-HC2 domain-containing protein [Burkholderia anthinoferrum]MCA8104872.1 zf-HC2 domain-containing protein [Burkholderia sp. AU36459]
MDCNEARALLDADVDRELSAPDALRVQQHVDGCDACRRERARIVTLVQAVRQADYHRAPDALRASILASLPAAADARARESSPAEPRPEPRSPPPRRPRGRGWFSWLSGRGGPARPGPAGIGPRVAALPGLGWGVALLMALAAAGGMAWSARHADTERTVDELVASHVRADLSARAIDVISTDQHTVKPWFNGRLDYAPPVEDLAASGFALVGGRLDYVGRRRVAVLVYRHRQHVVDVYVQPAGERPAAPYTTVSQGYALDRWNAAGMTWWAVTDAEPSALAAFRTALGARLAGARSE